MHSITLFSLFSGHPGTENMNQNNFGRAGGDQLEKPICKGVPGSPGSPGPLGLGCGVYSNQGSGGGGGYYGGGSSYSDNNNNNHFGGGGGGSSYSHYNVVDQGYNVGDGYAVFEWDWEGPSVAPTISPTVAPVTTLLTVPGTFRYIGDVQTFQVPPKVTSITVTLYAGSGQDNFYALGGRGAMIRSSIPVTPGETLLVVVGSAGIQCYNGGGRGSYSYGPIGYGGGATDIRRIPYSLKDRLLIAGGGGGAGNNEGATGGDGGVDAAE